MRAAVGSLVLGLLAAPDGGFAALHARPPSSLDPPPVTATVRFSYAHQVVRECVPSASGFERACVERRETAPSVAHLVLRPLREASLQNRNDERAPLSATVSTTDSNGKSFEVAPGHWELTWLGHERAERFRVDAGDGVDVALRSTAGRCDPVVGRCELVQTAMRKRIDLAFNRRTPSG